MKTETLNIILVGIIIYLLFKKNDNKTEEQKLKYAEAVGMAKASIGELSVTF